MTLTELISKTDSYARYAFTFMAPRTATRIYSRGRKTFLKMLAAERPSETFRAPASSRVKVRGVEFGAPLFNAAGMFKGGAGYLTVAMQGAGAFLAGTTTSNPRSGNMKAGIRHPFLSLPGSKAAINWMGLPNLGHETVARRLSNIDKISGCPIGASLAVDPEANAFEAEEGLLRGLELYARAGVDFMEINESCPNVPHGEACDANLTARLERVSKEFIRKAKREVPVFVKFSNDLRPEDLPALLDALTELGFAGVVLGNTSTNYNRYKMKLAPSERHAFEYFVNEFGGGVSGAPLREASLLLSRKAVEYLAAKNLREQFVVVRCGGVMSREDLESSAKSGIVLNQWFTGYFEEFARSGHELYRRLLS